MYIYIYVHIDFPLVALITRLVDLEVCWLRSLVEPNSRFEHLLDRFFERTRVYSSSLRLSLMLDDFGVIWGDFWVTCE